jgi:hypothetical protein
MMYHKTHQHLDFLRKRLVRVKRDDVWGSDHEGPYTPEEKAAEIVRLKAEIAKEEECLEAPEVSSRPADASAPASWSERSLRAR